MLRSKITVICLFYLLMLTPAMVAAPGTNMGNATVSAEPTVNAEEIIEEQLDDLSLESIQDVVNTLNKEIEQVLPSRNFTVLVKEFISNGLEFNWKKFFEGLIQTLFREILVNTKLLGELLVLTVVAALLKTFQDAFNNQGISQVSNGVVYLILIAIALNSFAIASKIGADAIGSMVDLMHALLPTLFTLLIGMGAVGSATIFQPIIFLLVSSIGTVIKAVVFPLIFLAVILTVVSSFTGENRLSKMGGFIKQIGLTVLGLSFVVFFGTMLIQGAAVSVADGLSLRTAKYLTSTFVPIVGGMFANSLELVVGCSLLIQNAVGLVGMLVIFVTVAFPVIKILALVFIYKLVSAIIQPIGEPLICDCLNSLGNTMMLIFISVTTVAIMFFIFITITVGIANMTVMLR